MVCSAAILEGFIPVPSSIVDEKRRKKRAVAGLWSGEIIFVTRLLTKYPDRDGNTD